MKKRVISVVKLRNAEKPLRVLETSLLLIECGLKKGDFIELRVGISKFRYPSLSIKQNQRFTRMVRIMGIVRNQIIKNETVSKRGVYYTDVSLFGSQRNVDVLIDRLVGVLDVKIGDLSLRAVSKGLYSVAGSKAELVTEQCYLKGEFETLVIIEKEAVFTNMIRKARANCVYVTGKGFPDRVTKSFVEKEKHRFKRIECVVDCDVYGIMISSQYGCSPTAGYRLLDVGHTDGFLKLTDKDFTVLLRQVFYMSPMSLKEGQRQLFLGVKRETSLSSG